MCKRFIYLICFGILLGLVLTNATNAQDPNLVCWFKFDDTSGTTTHDSSGNGFVGYLRGNPQWVNGYKDGAISLNPATEDYVELDIGQLIPTLDECTFSLWVDWAGRTGADDGLGWQRTLDIGSGQANYIYLCPSTGTTNMAMRVALVANNGIWDEFDASIGSLPTGWHHIAITVSDSTSTMIMYVDSESVGSKTNCVNSVDDMGITGNNWLGRSQYADPFFDGILDDFRIYNRVLSQNELGLAANPEKASIPVPANDEVIAQTDVTLQWHAGLYAADVDGHHVYFGDNLDDVSQGTGDTDKGLTSDTSYSITDLEQGVTYYWRIDEVNGTDTWIGYIWSFKIQPLIAYNPAPPDGADHVNPEIDMSWSIGAEASRHDIYLGTSFDDVNTANRGSHANVQFKMFHSSNTYDPGTLEFETTYYWRIDETKGATIWKGDVWSFTTIFEIPTTDPSLLGWWKLDEEEGILAIDWSGNYNHGTLVNGPEWALGRIDGALEFDGINDYVNLPIGQVISTLDESTLAIWTNFTNPEGGVLRPIVNFGTDTTNYFYLSPRSAEDGALHVAITVDNIPYDLDSPTGTLDTGWHHLAVVSEPNNMQLYLDGQPAGNMSPEFVLSDLGVTNQNWLGKPEWPNDAFFSGSLDDFRIYNRVMSQEEVEKVMRGYPLLAGDPKPANRSTADIISAATLSWTPGDNVVEHDVYFGTDAAAVKDANTLTADIYRGRQDANAYTIPEALDWNQTYYWRIDEYNSDGTIGIGRLWRFTIEDYIVVEDFEAYNDITPGEEGSNRIYLTWLDGFDNPSVNGATIGYPDPFFADDEHFVEVDIVNGGNQSGPLLYDNSVASYSEVTVNPGDLTVGNDWTKGGVQTLTIWFYGDPNNAVTEQLYVQLNGSKVLYDGDPADLAAAQWIRWDTDMSAFGINLANVTQLGIGLERTGAPGGSGILFTDDIRLYIPVVTE